MPRLLSVLVTTATPAAHSAAKVRERKPSMGVLTIHTDIMGNKWAREINPDRITERMAQATAYLEDVVPLSLFCSSKQSNRSV